MENSYCIGVSGNYLASSEYPPRKVHDHLRYVQKLVFGSKVRSLRSSVRERPAIINGDVIAVVSSIIISIIIVIINIVVIIIVSISTSSSSSAAPASASA